MVKQSSTTCLAVLLAGNSSVQSSLPHNGQACSTVFSNVTFKIFKNNIVLYGIRMISASLILYIIIFLLEFSLCSIIYNSEPYTSSSNNTLLGRPKSECCSNEHSSNQICLKDLVMYYMKVAPMLA